MQVSSVLPSLGINVERDVAGVGFGEEGGAFDGVKCKMIQDKRVNTCAGDLPTLVYLLQSSNTAHM